MEGKETIIPETLYRVVTPHTLKIKDGYFQPVRTENKFPNSLPMTDQSNLLTAATVYASPDYLENEGLDYFIVLKFDKDQLQEITNPNPETRKENRYYFAKAPTSAMIAATKYRWKEKDERVQAYLKGNFDDTVEEIGNLTLDDLQNLNTQA